jgi:hypothetical protein
LIRAIKTGANATKVSRAGLKMLIILFAKSVSFLIAGFFSSSSNGPALSPDPSL